MDPSRVTRKLVGRPTIIRGLGLLSLLSLLSLPSLLAAACAAGCTPKEDPSKGGGNEKPAREASPFAVGASTEGLAAAVKSADLGRPEVLAAIPARVRELASAGKEPRATAVMLRALSAAKHGEAAALACELLDKLPTGLAARGNDTELLVDATLLAVANGPGTCADAVKKRLGEDRCVQSLRCGKDGARLGIGATTDQREPLCSAEDLKNEVARDLARPKAETLEDKPAYATERLALAALRAMNAVPEDMERAHARRQYAVKQPEKPECGMGVALGAPCRCDEAALRDQVCRNDTTTIAFSFCRAEVSDAKKEIGSVVMSSPP